MTIDERADEAALKFVQDNSVPFATDSPRFRALVAAFVSMGNAGEAEMAWKFAQVLCEFCGEEGYNLIFHHGEWRHYRLRDMYVEYCKAEQVFHLCPDAAERQQ